MKAAIYPGDGKLVTIQDFTGQSIPFSSSIEIRIT